MKKILFIAFLSMMTLLYACKKSVVSVYDKPVEERVTEFLKQYQTVLTSSDNGWKVYLTPNEKNTYVFWMKFNDQNRVQMVVDINQTSATKVKESSYRFQSLQQPMLIFDTYNYIHILADPDPSKSDAADVGTGLQSDYEFYPDSATVRAIQNNKVGDTLRLMGQFNNISIKMVKATANEAADYTAGKLYTNITDVDAYFSTNIYHTITVGDKTYELQYNKTSRTATFLNVENNVLNSANLYYAYILDGINLTTPYSVGAKTIVSIKLDKTNNKIIAVFNDGSTQDFVKQSNTTIPLNLRVGTSVNTLVIPDATTYAGWSADFKARRAQANTNTLNSDYSLRMGAITMAFGSNATLSFKMLIYQGASSFTATYSYTYTKSATGVFKFNYQTADGNGALITNEIAPLFAERIDADTFKVDYFNTPTGAIMAQFTSIEHPDFIFTANF